MLFYLGTNMPGWLNHVQVPLFVSHRRLSPYKTLPVAVARWSLDSGGFTELSKYGRWTVTPQQYVAAVRRYRSEIGRLDWAAPQDAMCEPWILRRAASWLGGTVAAHQQWTVRNLLVLRDLDASLPIIPVIQGWELDDYLRHVDDYAAAGVDLTLEPVVGIGSVCRRQGTDEIASIVSRIAGLGIRIHGFGVKTTGLELYAQHLVSSDSMAWSFNGRHVRPCPVSASVSCASCVHYAHEWRDRLLLRLFGGSHD